MASSSNDPTTGAPIYLDSDAPDPAVNPTQVAAFAAQVGTRLIGTTAERTAYAYAREGLRWYDTTLDAEFLHDGSGWVLWEQGWKSYTPTVSGFANSAVAASYQVSQGVVHVKIRATVTAMTSNPTFTLPVSASDAVVDHLPGSAALIPAAGSEAPGEVRRSSATQITVYSHLVSATNVFINNISSTVPFTWTSGAVIAVYCWYRGA